MAYTDPNDPRSGASKRKHYEANKEKVKARARANSAALLAEIRERKNKPCMDCGVQHAYWVMDFDHRPGEVKLFEPSNLHRVGRGKMRAELDKCDVVCANCHRERTHRRAYGAADMVG